MLSKTEKLLRCAGCRDNYYNTAANGGCWHLPNARAADKLIYYSVNDIVPSLKSDILSCWHNNIGYGKVVPATAASRKAKAARKITERR